MNSKMHALHRQGPFIQLEIKGMRRNTNETQILLSEPIGHTLSMHKCVHWHKHT